MADSAAATSGTPSPGLRVRVVVLNWNGAHLTRRCVESLLRTDYPRELLDLVVVDNGSIDGSDVILQQMFPGVRFLQNGANLGFAEGCNRAMRDLDGVDAVALVNNDATVEPGWLLPLVDRLASDDRIGAVAPKMLLDAEFVSVDVHLEDGPGRARVTEVEVDGHSCIGRTIFSDDVVTLAHQTIPLALIRELSTHGDLAVPVWPGARRVTITLESDRAATVRVGGNVDYCEPVAGRIVATVDLGPDRHRRINNLGTGLTDWCEGFERRFGEPDRDDLVSEEVHGFCGGGVLLRSGFLRDVGVFDPSFFAYYEDTDLSWRGRRRGWRFLTEPSSVIHHELGGTAGSSWAGFFYLNYRNWLLTVERNGTRDQRARAFANARHLSLPYVRRNITGRVRRLQRPETAIVTRWMRVGAGLLAERRAVRATRDEAPLFLETDGSPTAWRFLPHSRPGLPTPRPGGPEVFYIDVTETLRAGWRAGIQRVVSEVVRRLIFERDDVVVVAMAWSPLDACYRRLDGAELARFFDPPPMRNHPPHPPAPPHPLKAAIGPFTRIGPMKSAKEEIRRRRDLARRPAHHRDLLVKAIPPGAVLFDLDAVWNVTDAPRLKLYRRLNEAGVRVAVLIHDLLPVTNPAWFDPNLARVFHEFTDAVVDGADIVITNSQHTAQEYLRYASSRSTRRAGQRVDVATFGTETGAAGGTATDVSIDSESTRALLDPLKDRRVLLVVGTIEPRKNHAILLDALELIEAKAALDDLTLVVVGRQGWEIDEVADRIRSHPGFGERVIWPESVDDTTLDALYRRADLVVVPSITEGFGLPVVEALGRGALVASSDGGALPEAGGDHVAYFDPTDASALAALIESVLTDSDHNERLAVASARYRPTSWSETADEVVKLIRRDDRRTR
ncbi:MAG: glycosyltransferase [Microthrixaceae bacterium]|nr:glycosyltransferase [Microthrixaceae bacterium]